MIYSTEFMDNKLSFFYERKRRYKKVLKKIIKKMFDECKYQNDEGLERHNWGEEPKKLKYIPKNKEDVNFEKELLEALSRNELEGIDSYINEVLWGDPQLGKRVHACIIMWFSVFILQRPVLYIFRNLEIDKQQLKDDIRGAQDYNFNIKYIKKIFDKINTELTEKLGNEEYKEFKLPELIDIDNNDIINKLSNRDTMNPTDIYCCLMNDTQLERINSEFSKYVSEMEELVHLTLLVDEADLMCPTAKNDRTNATANKKETNTACEKLLQKIYKKVKYSLRISGTAQSLLFNTTSKLSENEFIEIRTSQVHKMKRPDDYYGIMNKKINIMTEELLPQFIELNKEQLQEKINEGVVVKRPIVKEFWKEYSITNGKKHKNKYTLLQNYNINIKKILDIIINRDLSKSPKLYNSVLISEEKFKESHFNLVNKILKDYKDLFIILFHGNCLRLYFSKDYETELLNWSKHEKRLYDIKGIHGSAIDEEDYEKFPNNYCYFEINTKNKKGLKCFTIKQVYKLIDMLFIESKIPIRCKTVITVSGKYADRGYSFTSDDYSKYIFHLTDQIYFSHSDIICTNLMQSFRIQVKTDDENLKNGNMCLTLWTTKECEEAIEFYIKFITMIEKDIMDCKNWEDIKYTIEKNIDNGRMKLDKYIKYLDRHDKMRSIPVRRHYEPKHNGNGLISTEGMETNEISQWCEQQKLPVYNCLNNVLHMRKQKFIDTYGIYTEGIPLSIPKNQITDFTRDN